MVCYSVSVEPYECDAARALTRCGLHVQLALLLQFITGAGRLPLGGAAGLTPPLTIIASSGPVDSLPTAHTCFNRLVLPRYSSFAKLHWALGMAIAEGSQGFSFS